jgi:putative endonuclease
MRELQYYVYILASRKIGTLYIGVTRSLIKRVWEHKNDLVEGFTKKYKVHILVYFEVFDGIENALKREKQLKNWKRDWKINVIERENPEWVDLYPKLVENI